MEGKTARSGRWPGPVLRRRSRSCATRPASRPSGRSGRRHSSQWIATSSARGRAVHGHDRRLRPRHPAASGGARPHDRRLKRTGGWQRLASTEQPHAAGVRGHRLQEHRRVVCDRGDSDHDPGPGGRRRRPLRDDRERLLVRLPRSAARTHLRDQRHGGSGDDRAERRLRRQRTRSPSGADLSLLLVPRPAGRAGGVRGVAPLQRGHGVADPGTGCRVPRLSAQGQPRGRRPPDLHRRGRRPRGPIPTSVPSCSTAASTRRCTRANRALIEPLSGSGLKSP